MNLYDEVSFKTSKLITKRYSTSFSIAVRSLPLEMRQSIYSIYGFVRLADEIVDTFDNCDQKLILEDFENDYYKALKQGISMNPVLQSFAITVKKHEFPIELVDSFLKSMKADLSKQVYDNVSELDDYIHGSANVVGLMCLLVFVNGDKERYKELQEPAMKLGSAFQKVNFLRDLKADFEDLSRTYFPNTDLTKLDENSKNEIIAEIEADFKEAFAGIIDLPLEAKFGVYTAYVYYKKLLTKLKNTPSTEIKNTRIRVSDYQKLGLFAKCYFTYKLNII